MSRTPLVGFKLLLALLGLSAVVTEIATLVERGRFAPSQFFSFFTVESNLIAAATLLASAFALAAGHNDRLDALRGAATVYILVVGIGFSVLLADLEGITLTAVPWDNTVLHYLVPVGVLVDYLVNRPTATLRFTRSLAWLLFPLAYLAFALVRGAATGWYPYPFLDPRTHGAGAVAATAAGLLVLGIVLVWAVTRLSGRTGRRAP